MCCARWLLCFSSACPCACCIHHCRLSIHTSHVTFPGLACTTYVHVVVSNWHSECKNGNMICSINIHVTDRCSFILLLAWKCTLNLEKQAAFDICDQREIPRFKPQSSNGQWLHAETIDCMSIVNWPQQHDHWLQVSPPLQKWRLVDSNTLTSYRCPLSERTLREWSDASSAANRMRKATVLLLWVAYGRWNAAFWVPQ